jgi:hypothetical protein
MPSATSELRRSLNAYNLRVGGLSAAATGVATLLATLTGTIPDVFGLGSVAQALGAALALFVMITGMHTAAHTYFGWRFDRGLHAATAGEHRHAVRLLAPVERPGMSHYDPDGSARRALGASRAALGSR